MSEQRGVKWLWDRLRGKSRKELDRLQRDLIKPQHDRRKFVGDPNAPEHMRIKTRN